MTAFIPTLLRLVTAAAFAVWRAPGAAAAPAATAVPAGARAALRAAPAPGTAGSGFVANHGQWAPEVLYMTPIKGGRAWVTATGIVYDFSKPAKRKQGRSDAEPAMPGQPSARQPDAGMQAERVQGHVVKLGFAGALQPAVRPKGKLTTRLNYLIGNDPAKHAKNVPAYSAVSLEGMWPGVDLRLAQGPAGLSLSFKAADAAALAKARVAVEGASVLTGRGKGAVVATSLGQRSLGAVAVSLGSTRYAGQFSGGTVALVGRPQTQAQADVAGESSGGLVYSTFLGGGDNDTGVALVVNASGAVYVSGSTKSLNFPTTPGAYDRTFSGTGPFSDPDLFVTKLSADGSTLVYSTFLGGSDSENGSVAVDASGNAYIAGWTNSADFPTTPGAFDRTLHGDYDAFVAKLSADGSALAYSTFLGGRYSDTGLGVAVDASGAAYVTGRTESSNFPTTPGAFDTTHNGEDDAFVTKVSADGSALVYSTLLGGGSEEEGWGLTLDASGAAYVTGVTYSSGFPATPGAYDTTLSNSLGDAFVTKLSADGSALVYSTFLGGLYLDVGSVLAVDASGAAYITGDTESFDFPTTPGAFDRDYDGTIVYYDPDAFVTKLSADGSALVYSTYLGSEGSEHGRGLAVDASGVAHILGDTMSSDFPTTPGAFDTTFGGYNDAFVTKLAVDGSALVYSTLLGGGDDDYGSAIAVDASGAAYVTGSTDSSNFPTTPGAYDTTYNGGSWGDAFVTKLDLGGVASGIDLVATATPKTVAAGGSFTVNYTVSNHTGDAVTGDLFYTAAHDGKRVARGQIVSDTTVAAHGTRSGSFTQAVPINAEPGVYTYNVRIGQFPDETTDRVAFQITVTGAERSGGATAWQAVKAKR